MEEKYPLALGAETILAGQYIVKSVLGQGGFGITYKAIDYKTNEYVAIKEFFPDTLATRDNTQVIPHTGERDEMYRYGLQGFLEEANTLSQFIGVDGIVRVRGYFEENGTAYFVMDYVDGISFDKYIKNNGGKVSYEEAEKILLPVIKALSVVHSKGIVHRDVTPDNIYIAKDGSVKLLDFGASRYSLGDKSRSLDVVLKHGFAPKEQYTRHGKQGPYTDVYSLGASFYYAITGKIPPDSIDRIDEDNLVAPSVLGARIDADKEDAILKSLGVQPQDRYQSMHDFEMALSSNADSIHVYDNPIEVEKDITGNDSVKENSKGGVTALNRKTLFIGLVSLIVIVLIFVLIMVGSSRKGKQQDTSNDNSPNVESYNDDMDKPVEAEPVEAEPVEAEPVEAEPVEAEPVEAEPVEESGTIFSDNLQMNGFNMIDSNNKSNHGWIIYSPEYGDYFYDNPTNKTLQFGDNTLTDYNNYLNSIIIDGNGIFYVKDGQIKFYNMDEGKEYDFSLGIENPAFDSIVGLRFDDVRGELYTVKIDDEYYIMYGSVTDKEYSETLYGINSWMAVNADDEYIYLSCHDQEVSMVQAISLKDNKFSPETLFTSNTLKYNDITCIDSGKICVRSDTYNTITYYDIKTGFAKDIELPKCEGEIPYDSYIYGHNGKIYVSLYYQDAKATFLGYFNVDELENDNSEYHNLKKYEDSDLCDLVYLPDVDRLYMRGKEISSDKFIFEYFNIESTENN